MATKTIAHKIRKTRTSHCDMYRTMCTAEKEKERESERRNWHPRQRCYGNDTSQIAISCLCSALPIQRHQYNSLVICLLENQFSRNNRQSLIPILLVFILKEIDTDTQRALNMEYQHQHQQTIV